MGIYINPVNFNSNTIKRNTVQRNRQATVPTFRTVQKEKNNKNNLKNILILASVITVIGSVIYAYKKGIFKNVFTDIKKFFISNSNSAPNVASETKKAAPIAQVPKSQSTIKQKIQRPPTEEPLSQTISSQHIEPVQPTNDIAKAATSVQDTVSEKTPPKQIIKKIKFRDKQSGEIKEAIVKFKETKLNTEHVTVMSGDNIIAQGDIKTDFLSFYDKEYLDLGIGTPGELQKIGNCVYIDIMESFKPGGGTIFHKAVAQRSIDMGFNGRVALDAAWTSHPFHLKSGFVPLDDRKKPIVDAIYEKLAKASGKRIDTNWVGSMDMILTPENAQVLLNKPI